MYKRVKMEVRCSRANCSRLADCFCLCTGSEAFFCKDCFSQHFLSSLEQEHHIHPIATQPFYRIPGYSERLKHRKDNFPQVQVTARSSLTQIDAAIETIKTESQKLIAAINKHCKDQTEKLLQLKAALGQEVEAALTEVQATIYQDTPQFASTLSTQLWNCISESKMELTLFTCEIKTTQAKPYELVEVNYVTEALSQLLPGVLEGELRIYDMRGHLKRTEQLAVNFGTGGNFCRVDSDTLLCVGGTPFTTAVYALTISTAQLKPLASMHTARGFSGLLAISQSAYVFGGNWPSITRCEKLDLVSDVWTSLPDMHHPRHAFNPCLYEQLVYLADARQTHRVVETFNLASETFNELAIRLPDTLTGYSAAFIVDGELTVVTSDYKIAWWKIKSEAKFRSSHSNRSCSSNSIPLQVGREVLIFSDQLDCILRFNLDIGAFVE